MSSIDINTVLPIVTVDPTLPEQDEASSFTADRLPSEVGNHTGTFNHADQFSLLCTYFDEKFDKMKHQLKKAEPEPKTTKSKFKYKGRSNKIQGRFNEEILGKITQTKTLLESGAMKRPCRLLEEVAGSLHKRIKLIKIADKSPAGWETVKQYESGSIASDSEDERKIRAAEKRAIATRKASHTQTRPQNYTTRPRYPRYSTQSRFFAKQHSRYLPPTPTITRNFRTAKPTDICLGCGLRGHWKKDCPTTRNTGKDLTIRYETLNVDRRERISTGDASTHMPENETTGKTPTVKGKLKINLPFWENTLRANSTILTIIRDVPFTSLPPQASFKNNISAYQNKAFVDREVEQLLRDGCIVDTQSPLPLTLVNPITVSKNDDGKCRGTSMVISHPNM